MIECADERHDKADKRLGLSQSCKGRAPSAYRDHSDDVTTWSFLMVLGAGVQFAGFFFESRTNGV